MGPRQRIHFSSYTGAKAGLIQWSGQNSTTGSNIFRELPLRDANLNVQSSFLSENYDSLLATNYGPENREFSTGTRPEEAQLFLNEIILGGSSYTAQRKSSTTGRRADASQLVVFLTQASGNEFADTWATNAEILRDNLDNSYLMMVLIDKAETAYRNAESGNDGFGTNTAADGATATQILNGVVGLPEGTTVAAANASGLIQGREGGIYFAGDYASLDGVALANILCETAVQIAPITVNNVTVSEASDYMVFTLQAQAGRIIDAIEVTGQSATLGVDTSSGMQVYVGGAWQDYDGTSDLTVDSSDVLYIRMAVNNDEVPEGSENLRLTVIPALGTETSGIGTIVDDGSSDEVFAGDDRTSSTGTKDDDYVVGDVHVSEASPYLVFKISGHANRNLTGLTLSDGPGTGSARAVVGVDTHNPDTTALQYYDSDGGGSWQNYATGDTVSIMSDGTLYLRTAVTQDDDFEGPHALTLEVTPRVGVVKQGIGTIYDDGSLGTQFSGDSRQPSSGTKDDDRRIAINDVRVSEASTYLVFQVTSPDDVTSDRLVKDFALSDGPDSGSSTGKGIAVVGTDTQNPGSGALQYYDALASAWRDYTSGQTLTIPAGGTLYMRTAVTQDDDFEGPHNFSLTAKSVEDAARTGSGVGTLVDDGSEDAVFNDDDRSSSPGSVDDDRPLAVNDVQVSETSPYIVWQVTSSAGRNLSSIALASGTSGTAATPGIDTADASGSTQFQIYDGSTWVNYSGSGSITVPSSGSLFVRTKVQQDSVYEGPETLELSVTPSVGSGATGTGTIYDDGSVDTEFPASGPGETSGESKDADDDRPLAVNNVSVSEGSPYIVFKVTSGQGRVLTDLALSDGPGTGDAKAVIGTDTSNAGTGVPLQTYVSGTGWTDYTPASQITVDSSGLLYVRTAIVDDAPYEGPHVFTLTATPLTGTAATGQGTIYDDGSERPTFGETDTSSASTLVNDDRPITVNDVSVSEASSYIVFTLTGTAGQVINGLGLTSGTASVGVDTNHLNASSGLQVYDPVLVQWNDYTIASEVTIPSSGLLYLRTGIAQDSQFETDPDPEAFTVTATSKGGLSATGTGRIYDDGREDTVFTDPSPQPTVGTKDDDRPLSVNDVSVSESSSYIVFKISGDAGRLLSDLSLADGTATIGVDTQNAGTTPLQYWDGAAWKDYASGMTLPLLSDGSGGGEMYVRTGIVQDNAFETDPDPETFTLVVTPDGGAAPSSGTGSIYDDGSVNTTFPDPDRLPSPGPADDDRPIAVGDVSVSESSAYIVFNVTGPVGRAITTAGLGWTASGSKPLTLGGDVGTTLKCYNPDSGSWNSNTACDALYDDGAGGGEMYLRTTVIQDTPYEGPETATLTVTPVTGAAVSGIGTVYDDGSEDTEFPATGPGETDGTPGTADDDRPFEVNSVSVSELSPYLVFEVHGIGGFELDSLSLASGTSGSGDAQVASSASFAAGDDTQYPGSYELQYYQETGGWTDYNGSDNLNLPTNGILYVRTAVYNDNDSPVYEGPESFTLTAVAASGGTSKVGTGTIYDDGSEDTVFGEADHQAQIGTADDDRSLAVNNVTVSEASPYIVFEVSDNSKRDVTSFSLTSGTATVGTDTSAIGTFGVGYYDGSAWQVFDGTAISFPASGPLYVRTGVTQDSALEYSESFTITVTSGTASATGRGTIVDDGSNGTTFSADDTTPLSGVADDDRGIQVNDVTVSEASPHIVFQITSPDDSSQPRAISSLVLSDGDAGDGACTGTCVATTSGADADTGTSVDLEYYNGTTWVDVAGANLSIPAAGTLFVRTTVVQDDTLEFAHKFTLSATPATGSSAQGIGTIVDDGSEPRVFAGGSRTATNGLADDDRALSVNDVCVSENSTYIIWTINGGTDSANRKLTGISLKGSSTGTAAIVGVDTQDAKTDYRFKTSKAGTTGTWAFYNGVGEVTLSSSGLLYVYTLIEDDDDLEGVEGLTLIASPVTGGAASGQGYIFDDGSTTTSLCDDIRIFNSKDVPGTVVDETNVDDDRNLSINDVSVSESSKYIVFQLTAQSGRVISGLALSNGSATVGTDTSDAGTGVALQYYDSATSGWLDFVAGTTSITVDASGLLHMRTKIVQDAEDEGAHDFTLTVTPQSGSPVTGTGTIYDDGSLRPVFGDDSRAATGTARDDDRPISVNDVSVSEASPYLVFELRCGTSGTCSADRDLGGASLAGALEDSNQTATLEADTRDPGSSALQVYDGDSKTWVDYDGSSLLTIPAGSPLYMRTGIVQDSTLEMDQTTTPWSPETFTLTATAAYSDAEATGTGSIYDDGSQDQVFEGNSTQSTAGLADDDRPLQINNVSVSEASPYIVFALTSPGGNGRKIRGLTLADGTAAPTATIGTDTSNAGSQTALQVYLRGAWEDYVPGSIVALENDSGDGVLYLRTAIVQDDTLETDISQSPSVPETFTLTATPQAGSAVVGIGSIYDDGSEDTVFGAGDTTPQTGTADDDRDIAVNSISVSEASPFAVFEVTGHAGRLVSGLGLTSGTANADTSAAQSDLTKAGSTDLQVWSGTAWVDFDGSMPVAIPNIGKLYVRVGIRNDTPAVFEGPETFTLTATPLAGRQAAGTGTIYDDGTPAPSFPDQDPSVPPTSVIEDDRDLAVNDVSVSESSPFIVFKVSGPAGRTLKDMALSSGSGAGAAALGTDTRNAGATALQYFDETSGAWTDYEPGTNVTIPEGGTLYVRTGISNDDTYEGPESFNLDVTSLEGARASGTGTIKDDGTETSVFDDEDKEPKRGSLDHDLAIADVTVAETAGHIVFTVTSGASTRVSRILVTEGTAQAAVDYGVDIEVSTDGTNWTSYETGVDAQLSNEGDGTGKLYVRMAVINDQRKEGAETLTVTVTSQSETASQALGTITDEEDQGGDPATSTCRVVSATTQTGAAATTVVVSLQSRDAGGNAINGGGELVTWASSPATTLIKQTDNGDGSYYAYLSVPTTYSEVLVTPTLGGEPACAGFTITLTPLLSITQEVGVPVNDFVRYCKLAEFRFTVTNTGSVDLSEISIQNDLFQTFGIRLVAVDAVRMTTSRSATNKVNVDGSGALLFDGDTDVEIIQTPDTTLLVSNALMQPGESMNFAMDVCFRTFSNFTYRPTYEFENVISVVGKAFSGLGTESQTPVARPRARSLSADAIAADPVVTIATAADATPALVDPTGIIFDGVTSQPVAGALVQLWTQAGQVSESCLMPGQYNQTTDLDGKYGFDINPGCYPNQTQFEIKIVPPPGYSFPSNARRDEAIAGGENIPTAASQANGIYSIGNDKAPPTPDRDGVYALSYTWGSGDALVIDNHIPIDPTGDSDTIVVTKKALTTKAALGDIVQYELTATNVGTSPISGFRIKDTLPQQLGYIKGSSKISLSDATYQVIQSEPNIDKYNVMTWKIEGGNGAAIGALVSGSSMTVRYAAQVVDTASLDALTNVVGITTTLDEPIGNTAKATIALGDQPFFECSSVLGRVFDDTNGNGIQDSPEEAVAASSRTTSGGFWSWLMGEAAQPGQQQPSERAISPGERGLAGVKLFTVNGTWVTTDEDGRFSIPCADVPKSAFGTNYPIKVFERSLPVGYRVSGGNPKLVRLTRGLSQQLSIAVSKSSGGRLASGGAGNSAMTLFGVPISGPEDAAGGGAAQGKSGPVYLGLVDLRAGLIESNLASVQKPSDVGVSGRLAVYLKGMIAGEVLLTLMADTGLGDVDGLISGFEQKTAREMLKRIDPDGYYPVFGDGSSLYEDAPTSGKLYVRLQREASSITWGNTQLGLEYSPFVADHQTIYGAQLDLNSSAKAEDSGTTSRGDPKQALRAYYAPHQTGHTTELLHGTNGSVYFLRNTDIQIGSELIERQWRDPISDRVVRRQVLVRGDDYELNYMAGRLLLTAPMASVELDPQTGTQLNHLLFVSYSFALNDVLTQHALYGGEASLWVSDSVQLRGYIQNKQQQDGGLNVTGAGVTLAPFDQTRLSLDLAYSKSLGVEQFRSHDGGYTWQSNLKPGSQRMNARGFMSSYETQFGEWTGDDRPGSLSAYFNSFEAGFRDAQRSVERDRNEYGARLSAAINQEWGLNLGFSAVSDSDKQQSRGSLDAGLSFQLSPEISTAFGASRNWSGDEASSGLYGSMALAVSPDLRLGVSGDIDLGSGAFGVGATLGLQLTSDISLDVGLGAADGQVGLTSSQIQQVGADGNAAYLRWAGGQPSSRRHGATGFETGQIVLGNRSILEDGSTVFSETAFYTKDGQASGTTNSSGYSFEPFDDFHLDLSLEFGEVDANRRQAVSASGQWQTPVFAMHPRLEYRRDRDLGTGELRQTLLNSLRLTETNSDDWALEAYAQSILSYDNYANGSSDQVGYDQILFEGGVSAAYRPVTNDAFNALLTYDFVYELPPDSQAARDVMRRREHQFATEMFWNASADLKLSGKYAFKVGKISTDRSSDIWFDSSAQLAIARMELFGDQTFSVSVEGRAMHFTASDLWNVGAVPYLYTKIPGQDALRLGLGYNFGGIGDDLFAAEYDQSGFLVNLVGAW